VSAPHYLLDTALCLHVVREHQPWLLARAEHIRAGDAGLSVISWGALQYAAATGPRRLAALPLIETLAERLPILSLPPEAATAYRELRSRFAAARDHDLWLMAHARASGLELITHDARRFPPLAGVRVLHWDATDARRRPVQPRFFCP
jgi:tRNA(fMet)-specific endonuclease VapC